MAVTALLSLLLSIQSAGATGTFSATCSSPGGRSTSCTVLPGVVSTAHATGSFHDEVQETGWGRLRIQTRSTTGFAAFAAGYLEGALTASRIAQHLANIKQGAGLANLPAGVMQFMEKTDAWAKSQIGAANPRDPYWGSVRFIYEQMEGLIQGANSRLSSAQHLTRLDMLTINMQWDIPDIKTAVNVTERASFEAMSTEELTLWVQQRSHCSSVVKLLPDGSELFAGHNTWFGFHNMLRVFKRYEFGALRPVAMPSYPGVLSSQDDFYQVGHLTVMETTLPSYSNELLARVKPESLPFWIRAMVANRLAGNGSDWMEVFRQHNSGTYNNMWMVIDYSKFTPGQPLPEGVLTVGEQVPGYFHWEDQTETLTYGYWPSYNIAVYPETARLVKQDVTVKRRGTDFSHQLAPRAQIFRRDQAAVSTDEDMQRLMRYNRFQSDPLARGLPCNQLACRADLGTVPRAFGAIDAKYTSYAHNRADRVVVVAGPTHDDQRVFDWSEVPGLAAATSHLGQPQRFDFGWVVMGPLGEATPWSHGQHAAFGGAGAAAAVAGGLAIVASLAICLRASRPGSGPTESSLYKPLPGKAESGSVDSMDRILGA